MDKDVLKAILTETKRRLVAVGLAGVMIGTTSCSLAKENNTDNVLPERNAISTEYSNINNYYINGVYNNQEVKLYNSKNAYILFDKETYEAKEYIYYGKMVFGGLGYHVEVYDLVSEELLAYSDGIDKKINNDYYKYLVENNYQVCLAEVNKYLNDKTAKDYYSLEEIRALEPEIAESLKTMYAVKTRTK